MGTGVATYEFFVREDGKLNRPVRMHAARETGLPARIAMADPHGGMPMDYFGFNRRSDIEAPACLAER